MGVPPLAFAAALTHVGSVGRRVGVALEAGDVHLEDEPKSAPTWTELGGEIVLSDCSLNRLVLIVTAPECTFPFVRSPARLGCEVTHTMSGERWRGFSCRCAAADGVCEILAPVYLGHPPHDHAAGTVSTRCP